MALPSHVVHRTALLGMLLCVPAVWSEMIVGLTTQTSLISFDSMSPGTITTIGTITGLSAGDTLVGIDRRPQALPGGIPGPNNSRLYALGVNLGTGTARIYTLSEATAVATLIATLAADPADTTAPFPFTTVSGTSFGIDFNPVPDRLRVTSNTGQNLRLNVDNGLTNLDVPLAYLSGDPNFGATPVIAAVAYSNNYGGATTTVLTGVDIGRSSDLLVTHTNPNAGTIVTTLSLPFDSSADIGYDISGLSGMSYFSVTSAVAGVSTLHELSAGLIGTIGGGVALRDIAAPVGPVAAIPEPGTLLLISWSMCAVLCMRRRSQMRTHGTTQRKSPASSSERYDPAP